MNILRSIFASIVIVGFLGTLSMPLIAATSYPNTPQTAACTGSGGTPKQNFDGSWGCTGVSGTLDLNGAFKRVADTLIYLVGAISILMVIIGGLRYVLSGGDSAGVKNAKDTILYALIGVGVALVSWALVSFVISRL